MRYGRGVPMLVLSPRYSSDSISLWQAAIAAGWGTARVGRHAEAREIAEGIEPAEVAIYGETIVADMVAEVLDLALLEPDHGRLPRLSPALRLREVRLTTLGAARRLRGPVFVKPVDEKFFPARVYEVVDVDPEVGDDLPVLVAEPVRFGVEVRAFLCDREIVGMSAYIRDGQIAQTEDGQWPLLPSEAAAARACLERLLEAKVELPPAVVVDVGEIIGRGWAVVEANPAWASGLCGADPHAILPILRRVCRPRDELQLDERAWVRAPVQVEGL
jgi:hypothetical protein